MDPRHDALRSLDVADRTDPGLPEAQKCVYRDAIEYPGLRAVFYGLHRWDVSSRLRQAAMVERIDLFQRFRFHLLHGFPQAALSGKLTVQCPLLPNARHTVTGLSNLPCHDGGSLHPAGRDGGHKAPVRAHRARCRSLRPEMVASPRSD